MLEYGVPLTNGPYICMVTSTVPHIINGWIIYRGVGLERFHCIYIYIYIYIYINLKYTCSKIIVIPCYHGRWGDLTS